MHLVYDEGVANQTKENIMSEVLNKAGKSGEFLVSTIRNIDVKCQAAMDEILNIISNMTIAGKQWGGSMSRSFFN